jgi:BirA family biotin operon repressor/biotin-[acetyl-CoA-carboxylase] ligase
MSNQEQRNPAPFRTSNVCGWRLLEYGCVDSTNLVAAKLPAWHAVRADTQTAGRGRYQRSWVSDAGGLWLSAVVPLEADRAQNRMLPLVAGLSLINALERIGIKGARLRWPNDIMVEDRKLAGLLVDRFSPDRAVVGMGLNVGNQPALRDESLRHVATRLADLVDQPPEILTLCGEILRSLKQSAEQLTAEGFSTLEPRVNELWAGHRKVRLELGKDERVGMFSGVDSSGRLLLEESDSNTSVFEPHQITLLREI